MLDDSWDMADSSRSGTRDIRYQPNEQPPHLLTLGLGMQFVLLNIAGIVLTPAIIVRAAGTGEEYLSWAVFAVLCVSGVSTILQAVRVGRLGSGYVLLMGTSAAFIAVSVTALVEGGPSLLATLVAASALFQFVLASRLSLLRRVITPMVAGTVIMLIAVSVMPICFDMLANVPAGGPPAGAPASAIAALVCTTALALLAKGAWRLWAPVMGVTAGCIVASFYGMYDTGRIADAAWIGLPTGAWPGLDLELGFSFWSLLPVFVLVTVVGAVETIGDSIAIQQVSWRRSQATDFRAVQGAVAADGMGNLLSGLAGTVPNTTYSSSVAVTELTGVASRSVGVCAGLLLAIAAFCPKATALILAVPDPVVAANVTVLIGILFALGMRIVVQDGIDYRKSVVVGLAFWLGVGFQNKQIFSDLLAGSSGTILENGMTAGATVAILLTLVMELAKPRRRKMKAMLDSASLKTIDQFLRRFARDRGWSPEATMRLCAAAEESILSLMPGENAENGTEPWHLLVVASVDRGEAELEFIASDLERNLEDRLALLEHWAEQSIEHEFSLRLLRHYASSVRHQQYHNTDILTVRVNREPQERQSS